MSAPVPPQAGSAAAAPTWGSAPVLLGCFEPGRQPALPLSFDVPAIDAPLPMLQFDRWLEEAFGFKPQVDPAERGETPGELAAQADAAAKVAGTGAVARRALAVALELMRVARFPVFDAPQVLSVQPATSTPGAAGATGAAQMQARWHVRARLPGVDHVSSPQVAGVVQLALQLVFNAAAEFAQGREPDTEKARERAHLGVRRLMPALPSGISTVPVLQAAWSRGVAFRHLGGGVFQLGWGAKARRMHRSSVDTDSALGRHLAGNKVHTAQVLRAAGLPCPQHRVVQDADQALAVAQQLGWPVVIKPADRERSEGVTTQVQDPAGVAAAFSHASRYSKTLLVEQQIPGICYRMMIANGRFLYALWRRPRAVVGDGVRDIAQLLAAEQALAARRPPWNREKTIAPDELTHQALASQGLHIHSVPAAGQKVRVRLIESTEWGEDRDDATAHTHPDNVALAEHAARALGLVNAGVDVISPDIGVPWHANGAAINEVNFAPHFGGTRAARSRMPAFIDGLLGGDGRIPVEVFVGSGPAWKAALVRQARWQGEGLRSWVTDAQRTVDDQGHEQALACQGSLERSVALLCNPQVQALAIVLDDTRWLVSGAPVDRIDAWHDHSGIRQAVRAAPLVRLLDNLAGSALRSPTQGFKM